MVQYIILAFVLILARKLWKSYRAHQKWMAYLVKAKNDGYDIHVARVMYQWYDGEYD